MLRKKEAELQTDHLFVTKGTRRLEEVLELGM